MNILLGAMTISYFFEIRYSLWICLYFYLFYSDAEYVLAKKQAKEKKVRQIVQSLRTT